MKVEELIRQSGFQLLNDGGNGDTEISGVYCCDLLSIVMGSAPADCAWVTIMNNINTLAVAALTDCALLVLAQGVAADEVFLAKADAQAITVLASPEPIFETALKIHGLLSA